MEEAVRVLGKALCQAGHLHGLFPERQSVPCGHPSHLVLAKSTLSCMEPKDLSSIVISLAPSEHRDRPSNYKA
jgi:hypothetical protein